MLVEDGHQLRAAHGALDHRIGGARRGAAVPDAGRDGAPGVAVGVVALVVVVLVSRVEVPEAGRLLLAAVVADVAVVVARAGAAVARVLRGVLDDAVVLRQTLAPKIAS